MATPFNPNTLDFHGDVIKSSAEAVFVSAFATPEVNQLATIVNGIKTKKQIAILGRFNGLLGKGSGECDPTGRTVTTPLVGKLWEPATVSDRLEYCWEDIKETFFIWGTKNGIEQADLTATDFVLYIEQLLATELIETWMRIAYFGDTDAAHYNDSPAGVITNTTDLDFFNKIDGIWKQIYAIVGSDSTRKTAGLATRNAGNSYANQKFTAQDVTDLVVTNMFLNMEMEADSRLTSQAGLVFQVTKSVYDQYRRELTKANVNYTTERFENGMEQLNAGGIPVVKVEFWDRMILNHFNNGTKLYLPHRAILCVPSNVQVGTEEASTLTQYDIFYDKKTKTTNVDFQFNIDAKVILDNEIQVAY